MINRDGEHGCAFNREFESFQEVIDTAKYSEANSGHTSVPLFSGKANKSEWRGGFSGLSEYKAFVNAGWPEGGRKIREAIGSLTVPGVRSIRRQPVWSSEGDDIEIQKVYNGELDTAWRTTTRVQRQGGVSHVRVVVNDTMNGDHDADDALWRGAVGCVLVDALEEAGYRVELSLYDYAKGTYVGDGPSKSLAITRIKGFDEPLDINKVAATACNAGFLRVAMFAQMITCEKQAHHGLGMAIHKPHPYVEEGDVVIDNVFDRTSARRLLADLSKRFGE